MKGVEQVIYIIMGIFIALAISIVYMFALNRTQRNITEPQELTDIFTICNRLGIDMEDIENQPISELSTKYLAAISQTIKVYCKDLGTDLEICASACKNNNLECGKTNKLYVICKECVSSIDTWCIPASERNINGETERTPLKYLLDLCIKLKEYYIKCQKEENKDLYECISRYSDKWCNPYGS